MYEEFVRQYSVAAQQLFRSGEQPMTDQDLQYLFRLVSYCDNRSKSECDCAQMYSLLNVMLLIIVGIVSQNQQPQIMRVSFLAVARVFVTLQAESFEKIRSLVVVLTYVVGYKWSSLWCFV